MRKQEVIQIIKRIRKGNPYPEDIFTEPTKEEHERMRELLTEVGLIPDKFFGSFGRLVWNNCLDKLEEELQLGEQVRKK